MSDPASASHRSDLELVQAVLGGDASAFHKVFDLYSAPVMGFARHARADEDAAERLAGEILEATFANLGAYSGRTPLSAWVLAVARLVSRPRRARVSNG